MATDVDDLPTLDGDRIDAAEKALSSAKKRLSALKDEREEAADAVEERTDAVDTVRLDVAAGEATEEDLQEAKAELTAAKEQHEDLGAEIEEQKATIGRLEERLVTAREEVARDLLNEYAEVAEEIIQQKTEAMNRLATALEKAHDFNEKAQRVGLAKDERLVSVADAVRADGGHRVAADSLRYRAGKIRERKLD